MSDTLQIGDRTFKVKKPTLEQMDFIVNDIGYDVFGAITTEEAQQLSADRKKIARLIAYMVKDNEEKFEELADYIYKNATLSDFTKAMSFFGQGSGAS